MKILGNNISFSRKGIEPTTVAIQSYSCPPFVSGRGAPLTKKHKKNHHNNYTKQITLHKNVFYVWHVLLIKQKVMRERVNELNPPVHLHKDHGTVTVSSIPVSRALIGSNPAYLGCVHAISPNLSNLQIGLRFVNYIVWSVYFIKVT